MQNSSEFQYIAIDQIHESATNPRRTFDEAKLGELAESIRTNGLIQPITLRPNNTGFEIVAGARRFRAAQLAELFSIPARIVAISDSETILWQLVGNSQRVDVQILSDVNASRIQFQELDLPGTRARAKDSAERLRFIGLLFIASSSRPTARSATS